MSRQFLTNIDLAKNQLENAVVQVLGGAPTGQKGLIYFDDTTKILMWHDGTNWQSAKGGAIADGDKGDITTSSSGTVWTIDPLAVTNGKIADGAVSLAKMGIGSVDSSKVVDGTLVPGDMDLTQVRLNTIGIPTASVNMNNQRLLAIPDTPGAATDAVNKNYVDGVAQGLTAKESVRLATTAPVASYNPTGGTGGIGQFTAAPNTLDGISLAANDRILVKDSSVAAGNGIYVVTTLGTGATGVWDRAPDFNTAAEAKGGSFTFVTEGATQADTGWVVSSPTNATIGGAGGPAITWVQFSAAGQIIAGAGLTKTGNTLDVVGGNGIVANADDVAVKLTSTFSGLTVTASGLQVAFDASPGLQVGASTGLAVLPKPSGGILKDAAGIYADTTVVVPTARTVSTTAPLTGGGDLSANRTLAVNNYSGGANTGVVPTGGSGTTFLRGDGTWATPGGSGTINRTVLPCAAAAATVVAHTYNTRDVQVQVYRTTTPWDQVECDVEHTSTTSVTVRFATAPAAGAYQIVVMG
jgi:hypothetical protein